MSLIALILILALIGLLLWLINTKVPMDPNIKTIINVVALIVIVLWLLSVFGLLPDLRAVKVPKV